MHVYQLLMVRLLATRKCRTLWGWAWASWYGNITSLMSDVTRQVKHPAQYIHHSQTIHVPPNWWRWLLSDYWGWATCQSAALVWKKKPGQRRLKLMHAWQLQTVTDKGSLFTDSTIKSHTVVEFTSGKGYAKSTLIAPESQLITSLWSLVKVCV